MKTTKKQFIEQITSSNSIFLGVAKKLYSADELKCILGDYIKDDLTLYEQRSVIKASDKKIVFNDNCVLSLDQIGKYYFSMFNLSGKIVLSCTTISIDDCDGSTSEKTMYYGIV